MLLTSSRTNPSAPVDIFSDYDVVVIVTDIQPYLEPDSWLDDFGPVLVVYRDPIRRTYDSETFTRVTHYQDGTKIDFSIWPIDVMQRITAEPYLPDFLDREINRDRSRLSAQPNRTRQPGISGNQPAFALP